MNEVLEPTVTIATDTPAPYVLTAEDELVLEQVKLAVRCAEEKKALDPVVLRLLALTEYTDYFVIFSGANTKQTQAIADEVALQLKKTYKLRPLSTEGHVKGEWILLDFGTFVVHVFVEAARQFYDLERLWRDAERVAV